MVSGRRLRPADGHNRKVINPDAVRIPTGLLPLDGRFGCGPSKIRRESLEHLAGDGGRLMGTSHRQAPVRSLVHQIRGGLTHLFALPEGYEVVLGVGGATCFWDVATLCLIERRSQHLVFGEFSSKFASSVENAPHLEMPIIVESAPGSHPRLESSPEVDAYALTHNETSTGVAMAVARPDRDGLVLVDATSAAGAMAVDPLQFDCYYFSPQKVFGSDGGLWLALMSPAAIERVGRIKSSGRWVPPFLDLQIAIENSRLDQTYNTPALATLSLMYDQLTWILENGGLDFAVTRSKATSDVIYSWAESRSWAQPFVTDPAMRSPVVATIDLDERIDAKALAGTLRANGIVDTDAYRKLGRNQLRLGCFPAVEPDDARAVTVCVDYLVDRLTD